MTHIVLFFKITRMKKLLLISLCLLTLFSLSSHPVKEEEKETTNESYIFTDSCGREVTIPKVIESVSPSGAVSTMFLSSFAPEKMVTISGKMSSSQMHYLSKVLGRLPETGQMYGSKANLNLETLLSSHPDVVIDLGDYKQSIKEDLDTLQKQIGIPCIYIRSDLEYLPDAFRTLGKLLGDEEKGEKLAQFAEETLKMAKENSSKITTENKKSIYYAYSDDGLGVNAKGSTQCQVLDITGVDNSVVVENVSNKGGGNTLNMEEVLNINPEIIIYTSDKFLDEIKTNPSWMEVGAIKSGKVYKIPTLPYNWMGNPPSMNMLFGIWWLGNLIYPEYYSYDIVDKTIEMYSLFYNYDMSREEAEEMIRGN